MSEILVKEAKSNWTNRIAVSVENIKSVIARLINDKKSKHKKLAQQEHLLAAQGRQSANSLLQTIRDEAGALTDVVLNDTVDADGDEIEDI